MKVGIIGGGAAGMMAAISAAEKGHQVVILEHNDRVGRKILSTGSGKCNLTNTDMDYCHFHGGNSAVIENVLDSFSKDDTIRFFSKIGLYTRNRNGFIYPFNEQASSVLDILRAALRERKVEVVTDCVICGLHKSNSRFEVSAVMKNEAGNSGAKKLSYKFDSVIIAAGSKAAPKTGSDGSGYALAGSLGHNIVKPLPALCGLKCDGDYFKALKGIRCKGRISIYIDKELYGFDEGELQFNDYGISGIPAMQLSFIASRALSEGKKVKLALSFMPEFTEAAMTSFLKRRIADNPGYSSEELFLSILNKKLTNVILKKAGITGSETASELSESRIKKLCGNILGFEIVVRETCSFDDSQVCCGGVDLNEVSQNLESKLVKGLYFAGEILDVNGDCGGYNLQWAWSSGFVAGCLLSD